MNKVLTESELIFDFTNCISVEKYDTDVPTGLSSVDFAVETNGCLYLIEVKNYEQSHATEKRRKTDYGMLTDPDAVFPLDIGTKIKDSLLRKYADGYSFTKPVIALLIMKQSEILAEQRLKLFDRIKGHIPTGLNNLTFANFTNIMFDMPKISDTEKYGFTVTEQRQESLEV
jgi:hypothetical protein